MSSIRRAVSPVLLSCLLMAGCSSGSSGSDAGKNGTSGASAVGPSGTGGPAGAPAQLPQGPGPQSKYTVQKQPPAGSCHYRKAASGEPLPDAKCTPGATNPAVTQATLAQTICKPGYSKTVRPPAAITDKEKRMNAASYGYTGSLKDAEYDHLDPIEDGGDPNDPRNIWVELPDPGHVPGSGINNKKDPIENKIHKAICSGKVKLTDAQNAITSDWTTALSSLGLS